MITSTFRETVALVAAKAKAKLPASVNGRIEGAVKLVLAHDIEPQADGTILVGSSSDPMKTYRVQGTTCTCQDFTSGKAPAGWCKHRISAGISKRVREVLEVQEPPVEPWPDNDPEEEPEPVDPAQKPGRSAQEPGHPMPLPEAPASVNVRVVIDGREVQWTLRDTDEARLAERLHALLARYPAPQQPQTATPGEGWCAVHSVAMHWNEGKEGRKGWWSHRTDEGWCKGR